MSIFFRRWLSRLNFKLLIFTPLIVAGLLPGYLNAFQWPVLLDVNVEITGAGTAKYTGSWATIEVDDALDGTAAKYTGVIHRHVSTNGSIVSGSMTQAVTVSAGDCPDSRLTLSCVGKKWIEANGESGSYSVNHSGTTNGNECVAIASVPQTPNAIWADRKYPQTGAAQCLGTPPAEQWCALATPAIEFAYGTLTLKDAPGKKISHTINVECTDDISFILRLRGQDNIPLDNGMYAELTTDNDTPLGETLAGQKNNTIELTSELKGKPTRIGPFNGAGILFVTYP